MGLNDAPIGTLRLAGADIRSDILSALETALGEKGWAFNVSKISLTDSEVPQKYLQFVSEAPLSWWKASFYSEPLTGTMNGRNWDYQWRLDHFVRPSRLSTKQTEINDTDDSKVFATVFSEFPHLRGPLLLDNRATAMFGRNTVEVPRSLDAPTWAMKNPIVEFRQVGSDGAHSYHGAVLDSQISLMVCHPTSQAPSVPEGADDA